MNIDELRQSLSAIAEDARPDATTTAERIDAVDQLVKDQRRNTVVGAVAAAAVAIAAVAIAPAVLGGSDSTEPAHHTDNGLPAVVERGTAFYTQPAGSTLIGHGVAEPGAREISFTFTPSTLNLSWEQECWDPQLKGLDKGAWYSSYVNGHPLGGSTCQGPASADPLNGTGSFGESPAANENGWQDMGVQVGEPSTFTLRLTKHADRAVDPQLVAGVWSAGSRRRPTGSGTTASSSTRDTAIRWSRPGWLGSTARASSRPASICRRPNTSCTSTKAPSTSRADCSCTPTAPA